MSYPTHRVTVRKKPTGDGEGERTFSHDVGAAWQNKDGRISIQLKPCVVLTDRDDIYINLYPTEPKPKPIPGATLEHEDLPF
jgi:hypothetical protein